MLSLRSIWRGADAHRKRYRGDAAQDPILYDLLKLRRYRFPASFRQSCVQQACNAVL
jgi:hypothetical protein